MSIRKTAGFLFCFFVSILVLYYLSSAPYIIKTLSGVVTFLDKLNNDFTLKDLGTGLASAGLALSGLLQVLLLTAASGKVLALFLPGEGNGFKNYFLLGSVAGPAALFAAGAAGYLPGSYAVFFLAALSCLLLRREISNAIKKAADFKDAASGFGRPGRLMLALAVLCLLTGFFKALLPAHGYDELMYHLPVPLEYIKNGRISPRYDILWGSYPPLSTMLYTLGIISGGLVAPKLINFFYGLFILYLLVTGRERERGGRPLLSVFLLASSGLFLWLMSYAGSDVLLGYFIVAGLGFLAPGRKLSATGLVFSLGGMVLSKYTGFVPAVIFLAIIAAHGLKAFKAVLIGLALVTSWFFLYNWHCYGNPVNPYMSGLFGSKNVDGFIRETELGRGLYKSAWPSTAAGKMLFPFYFTFRDKDYPYFRENRIGPLFLAFLPALFFCRRKQTVVFTVLYGAAFMFFMPPSGRFFLPAVLGAASALSGPNAFIRLLFLKKRLLAAALLLAAFFPALLYNFQGAVEGALYTGGFKSGDRILGEKLKGYYRLSRFIAESLPDDGGAVLSIGGDERRLYLGRRIITDFSHRDGGRVYREGDFEETLEIFHNRGIRYVYINDREGLIGKHRSPFLDYCFQRGMLKSLYEDNEIRFYGLGY